MTGAFPHERRETEKEEGMFILTVLLIVAVLTIPVPSVTGQAIHRLSLVASFLISFFRLVDELFPAREETPSDREADAGPRERREESLK